jgi:hypothetical protein
VVSTLAKQTFHLVTLGEHGKVLLRKKFSLKQLVAFTGDLQTSLIGLEVRTGARSLVKLATNAEEMVVNGPPICGRRTPTESRRMLPSTLSLTPFRLR